jgi:hypothetical protein
MFRCTSYPSSHHRGPSPLVVFVIRRCHLFCANLISPGSPVSPQNGIFLCPPAKCQQHQAASPRIRLWQHASQGSSCKLSTRDHCSYDALSYAWCEPDLTELLLVDNQEVKISKNLHTILLHLRYPDRIHTLWIDAICISQQDGIEKGQQVTLMGQIYQRADTVFCWLGRLSAHRLRALEFLQVLAEEAPRYKEPDQVEFYWTIIDDELVPGVDVNLVVEAALKAHVEVVYESDWFTRLLIVQELALARNPRILCGAHDLSWEEFELATRILASCLRKISHYPKTYGPSTTHGISFPSV